MTGITQARRGLQRTIAEDRTRIAVTRAKTITDPVSGETILDPYANEPETVYLYCRLPHKRKLVPSEGSSPAGFNEDLERMALFDWKNVPHVGDTFEHLGKNFELGPVDTITYKGKIKGYQAPMKEAE